MDKPKKSSQENFALDFDVKIMIQAYEKALKSIEQIKEKYSPEGITQNHIFELTIAFYKSSMDYIRENKRKKDGGYY